MAENQHFQLHVNGSSHEIRDAWVGESLLYVLARTARHARFRRARANKASAARAA